MFMAHLHYNGDFEQSRRKQGRLHVVYYVVVKAVN